MSRVGWQRLAKIEHVSLSLGKPSCCNQLLYLIPGRGDKESNRMPAIRHLEGLTLAYLAQPIAGMLPQFPDPDALHGATW